MKHVLTIVMLFVAGFCLADTARVVEVHATNQGETWQFDVTVRHEDAGWDHYADAWEIISPDGAVLGTRTLLHPHETEQPFTRSLGGVVIPEDVQTVKIRARDSVHGWGAPVEYVLPR